MLSEAIQRLREMQNSRHQHTAVYPNLDESIGCHHTERLSSSTCLLVKVSSKDQLALRRGSGVDLNIGALNMEGVLRKLGTWAAENPDSIPQYLREALKHSSRPKTAEESGTALLQGDSSGIQPSYSCSSSSGEY